MRSSYWLALFSFAVPTLGCDGDSNGALSHDGGRESRHFLASSVGDGAACDARAPAAGPVPFDNPSAVIRNVTVSGDLCPAGTAVVNLSPTGEAVTVVFASQLLGADNLVAARCSVSIEIEEPEGYHIKTPYLQWLGTGTATTAVRAYAYEGGQQSRAFSDEVIGDYEFADDPGIWAPSCTRAGRVRFVATIVPLVRAPGEVFALDALDMVTAWRSGVEWRRSCSDPSPIEAPPGASADWCGGRQMRPCGCGLACEYDLAASTQKEGACVDPAERLAAGQLGDPCGGLREINCAGALICWKPSQAAVDQRWLGRCVSPIGDEGATCQYGIPSLDCRDGLHCALESHRCRAANGELGSLCGEGLPTCLQGLRCNGTQCVVPRPAPGAAR